MVLSALSTIGTFTTQGLPQMSEFVAVIKTYNSKPAYSLRILRDASELEITGPLDFGITRAVANLLSDHPTIRTIHLNSDGGRLAEADALKNLILKLQLNTYVARNCASACVTVFVAGANRWLSRNAQIGLHSPYFPGSTEEDIKAAAESAKAFFYSRNIASDLIERGFNTPANEMWVPDHTTIFASNLATSYATERDVAASGITLHELDELETQLLKVSLFAAIKASYPDDYRMVIEQMRKGYLQGRDLADLRLSVLPTITKLYEKALPTASDSAMLAFWELLLEQALILRDISSNQCEAYLKGDSGKFDVNGIPASLLQKEMEVGAALLRSRGTYSGEMISDLMAQDAYLKLFEAMNKKYGVSTEQLLRGMEFKSTAEENCNMMLLLIREGLQLDLPDRLIVFRSMAQEAGRQP
jgi:ATP-dependent protease ClpP protease subunit